MAEYLLLYQKNISVSQTPEHLAVRNSGNRREE